ncbi:hypothetical protein ABL78_0223 [Leptomonas seymouri]|uniref:Uncharacterized protein n=1 Tax=Leptomonas seymouri TaxID=5684 RepID=A0A0N0P9E5_LEPSE|nr:hypothetical protein ABL78_0223 [Leptomonas seymouri]|eukprot:KPI90627.1 hypothetical protein ABL78_0223 [Leptomonas seymouri]
MTSRRASASATAGLKRTRDSSGSIENNRPRASAKTAVARSLRHHQHHGDMRSGTLDISSISTLESPQREASTTEHLQHQLPTVEKHWTRAASSSTSLSSLDDDAEALQRFSNTSTHPRRSHKPNTSPPKLSTTPPPSPLQAAEDLVSFAQRKQQQSSEYEPTKGESYIRVSPSATATDHVGGGSPHPPSLLLSELLLAEAERAGAAAANMDSPYSGIEDPAINHHRIVSLGSQDDASRLPLLDHGYADQRLHTRRASSSNRGAESLGPLPIQIGVVPLPRSTGKETPANREGVWLPWMRGLHTQAATLKSEPTEATQALCMGATSPSASAEAEMRRACIRFLRPRRLLTRSETTPTATPVSPAHPNSANISSVLSRSEGSDVPYLTTGDVIGWSGLFGDVPIPLPGTQPLLSRAPSAEISEAVAELRKVIGLPPDAQMCVGAATVMLMLA